MPKTDIEIKIDITKYMEQRIKAQDDKKYEWFIKKSLKLLNLKDKRDALNRKTEKILCDIKILEEELYEFLDK